MNGKGFVRIFFRSSISNNLKSKNALQADSKKEPLSKLSRIERISECIFRKENGSLTVEAALALSIFLITAWSLLSMFTFFQLQVEIEQALTDFGKEIGDGVYLNAEISEIEAIGIEWYLEQKLKIRLKDEPASKILEGEVSLSESQFMEQNSEIYLKATYRVASALAIPQIGSFTVTQEQVVRGWNGFLESENGKELDIVYKTTYGEVYHTALSCRYLDRTITPIAAQDMEYQRNESGGKYYPCEYCNPKEELTLYITSSGTRYHKSLNCQGLVRTIYAIPKSDIGEIPACSICGG